MNQSTPLPQDSAAQTEPIGTAVIPAGDGNALGHGVMARDLRGGAQIMSVSNLHGMVEFAQLMAKSGHMIPPAFRENPGACLGIVSQAMRWGMEPFGLAGEAYVTKSKGGDERVAFMSKAITAVINSNAPLVGVLEYEFDGAGDTRRCIVTGMLRNADGPSIYQSPEIGTIQIQNSPLWKSDPDQQLGYYASRAWARRYCPQTLLGVLSVDEVGMFVDRDAQIIAPRPDVAKALTAQIRGNGQDAPEAPVVASDQSAPNPTGDADKTGDGDTTVVDEPALVFPTGDLFEDVEPEPA